MYVNEDSYNVIIDWLNENGYRSKRDDVFGKNSIAAILSNEKYTGIYIFNRTKRKQNSHKNKPEEEIVRIHSGIPRIIEDELWREAKKNSLRSLIAYQIISDLYLTKQIEKSTEILIKSNEELAKSNVKYASALNKLTLFLVILTIVLVVLTLAMLLRM